jgi:hypothetical protein
MKGGDFLTRRATVSFQGLQAMLIVMLLSYRWEQNYFVKYEAFDDGVGQFLGIVHLSNIN